MLEVLFRFNNRPDADNAWLLLRRHAEGLQGIWIDYIGINGISHIAVISDSEEVMHQIRNVLPFPEYDNKVGVQVDWPPNIMQSILSLRRYLQRRGVREVELRYSPGMFIPIKHKRDPGTLI